MIKQQIKLFNVILFILSTDIYCQNVNYPLIFGRIEDSKCEVKVRVNEEIEDNNIECDYGNNFDYLYPVYIENFDHKEDLPNNWSFNLGYTMDDNVQISADCFQGKTWLGPESYINNLEVINGIAYLRLKKEDRIGKIPSGNCVQRNYRFTNAILNSLFKVRQGKTFARIKLPENPNMWPAFWLYGSSDNKQEIDIFEFFDKKPYKDQCDIYHRMKMTLHGSEDEECERGRKFPVPNAPEDGNIEFFKTFHDYEAIFTDYKVQISLDNQPKGYGTKYYDRPFKNINQCDYGFKNYPKFNFTCQDLFSLDINRKILKDQTFPTPSINKMNIIINGGINIFKGKATQKDFNYENQLYNSWGEFEPEDRDVAIDQFIIWQPINCSAFRNICSLQDIWNITAGTHFLSGGIIKISSGFNNCVFQNVPPFDPLWEDHPLHLLATDEIEIGADAEFRENTFLRAEIIPCTGESFAQKPGQSYPIIEDELATEETIRANEILQDIVVKKTLSKTDNGAITIFPNPTSEKLFIDMDEEDYNDITQMEITDNLGRKIKVEKNTAIDVSDLTPGFYELKFLFSHGFLVVKSFIKK